MKTCIRCKQEKADYPQKRKICRECYNKEMYTRVRARRAKDKAKLYSCWGREDTIPNFLKDPRAVVTYQVALSRIKRHKWEVERALTTVSKKAYNDKPDKWVEEVMAVTRMVWV